MQEAEWKLLDRQALGVIRLTLSRNVAFNIAKETTTAESRGGNLIRRNERGRSNYRGQSRDRRSKSRNPNNFQNSKTVECWNCGKIGHYKNQCKGTPKGKEVKAEANVTSTGEGDDALICSLKSKEESWVLDSGASFHATSNKNFFEKYVHRNLGQVYLGDDQPCDIVGQGNVKIKLNGSAWELKDVKHVPDLRKNLISVGQLAREDSDMNDIIKLKHQLSKEFDMKDLGPAKKILGMQITRDKQRGTLQLSQSEYIKRVLQRFNMGDAKP
uniref:CCHC-type domain-containing protein n=1 Tax=Chenopodium quinoa TaxID=63459 RepID=A0A803KZS8_CHEQI